MIKMPLATKRMRRAYDRPVEMDLDRDALVALYRSMLITRGLEEMGHILYKQGKIPGSFYTGRGNEGAAVGVATAMGPDDVGAPLHRDMVPGSSSATRSSTSTDTAATCASTAATSRSR